MFSSQGASREGQSQSGNEGGEDLSTILSPAQQADLTILLAEITDSMRSTILRSFDATAGLDVSLLNREGLTEDEKMFAHDPSTADVDEYERQRELKEKYERELDSIKMKELKKDSLEAFDQWRESVLLRVGEVVNHKKTAKDELQKPKRHADQHNDTQNPKLDGPSVSKIGRIVETPDTGSNIKFKDMYPPIKNSLTKLSMEQRTLVLHSVLLIMLSLKHYLAPSRVLLLILCSSLKLPLKTLEQDEYATAKGLLEGAKELSAEEETRKKADENKGSRKWKVGLATAAGAALVGVTGGLAAPLVAAGVGSVMGGLGLGATTAATYLGSVAGSTYLIGGLFGAYGGRMTGQMMDNYAREVEDFEFLPVHSNKKTSEKMEVATKQASEHDHKLRVVLCISGWLTEKEEVVKPWRVLGCGAEVFALKFELEAMLNLGNAMKGLMESAAWGYAKKQIIAQTIFADLAAAMWPIGLLKAARVIDNPFNIAKARAEKAGEVLADALINRAQGERPVTLVGYSLGARVIYICLMNLAKRRAFGLVENVVLIGSPTPSDTADWRVLRTAVSGRLINVYSQQDYVLGFMYRTSSLQYGVAGLQAVQGLPDVENVDVSEAVTGHLRYRFLVGSILKTIGFEDIDMIAVEEEKKELERMEEEEKQNSLDAQRKRLIRRESSGGTEDEAAEADQEASEIEKDVQAKTKKSLVSRAVEYFYVPRALGGSGSQEEARSSVSAGQSSSQVKSEGSSAKDDGQQSVSQRAYNVLPSMPYMTRTSPNEGEKTAVKDASMPADTNKKSNEGYASKAASFLPSIPKSLPSLPVIGQGKQPSSESHAAENN